MTTITHASGTIVPTVVDGYEASIEARSIVHNVMGRTDPDITLRPAGMRTGTLSLVFASRAAGWAALAALCIPQVLTLTDADVPEVGMSFVVAGGAIKHSLDDETRDVWILGVPFQEVLT
ncbi:MULTISPECIES: hypothetical protein [unclassified Microbacterium]|uniref:hypothetical protein n=1 Tax=unclassified Microbacterium TaxID=2609290 RepID=UPI000CFBF96A|nr:MULTISPECIES: hypothetical protein [unclassified Microbacterium]PQZ60686.1 hypothetical protein CQ032_04060 [Microbacterium sp. MYb43]PQZ82112.1 hypothetical protein CQ031_01460 [Microbacterium sp. MYb40]PRB22958.1 hypothetical protein CQ037_18145 [Microbacterium sp. MYb50]PRB24188.1 hypothetical protein CQ040_02770 [Microbacterium sp. MYb54]PRB69672.1 hypothetical protein CQ021_02775 [Microbacterium sp. MYb24]